MMGDAIGHFLHAEKDIIKSSNKHLGKILVEIDKFKCMITELLIDWRGISYS